MPVRPYLTGGLATAPGAWLAHPLAEGSGGTFRRPCCLLAFWPPFCTNLGLTWEDLRAASATASASASLGGVLMLISANMRQGRSTAALMSPCLWCVQGHAHLNVAALGAVLVEGSRRQKNT